MRAELLNTDVLLDMVLGDIPIIFQTRMQRLINFIFNPGNLVDLVAIIPWYLEYLFHNESNGNGFSGTAVSFRCF